MVQEVSRGTAVAAMPCAMVNEVREIAYGADVASSIRTRLCGRVG